MRDNKTLKITIFIGLIVAAITLAIGFAAFSSTLNISAYKAEIGKGNEEENFSNLVNFVSSDVQPIVDSTATATAGTASGHTWSGITVNFTSPGQTISLYAQVENQSNYFAYINDITTNGQYITCTGSAQNLDAICSKITATVEIEDYDTMNHWGKTITSSSITPTSTTVPAYGAPAGMHAYVYIYITFASDAIAPDSDISINIPAISVTFGSKSK